MTRTQALSDAGVSIWLDDLSRERLDTGNLAELIATRNVVGVTTNPAIFAAAMTSDHSYDEAIEACRRDGLGAAETIEKLSCEDVRRACDVLAEVYERTAGTDGRVSIEVEPELAHDAGATIERARQLWQMIDRPNLMVKIPATRAGLVAIAGAVAEGISVNVTLIFSITRYREVINAYLTGLERARAAGIDIGTIHSVASFFISRMDSAVDSLLDAAEDEEARSYKGLAGIANARLAYEAYLESWSSERASYLARLGANPQRLLWASTGVKDPVYPDTMYVTELVAPHVVNTMPENTLEAVAEHAEIRGDTVTDESLHATQTMNDLARYDIDYVALTEQLEIEGLQKFETSWNELVSSVTERLEAGNARER